MRLFLNGLFVLWLCLTASGQRPEVASTESDRGEVAVTVYNNGLGLVRETRHLTLPTGEILLQYQDVAEQIRPETVSLRSVGDAGSVRILEQNYEYDLISPSKLMEKYVGLPVRLLNKNNKLDFVEVTAELLSMNEGPVYRIGKDIYLGHPGNVVLPEMPKNLSARPSLVWLLENAQAQQKLEVTYLTQGLSWKADYVVSVPGDESSLDLAGWVTIDNHSGATYAGAQLKLVAGEVNLASPEISHLLFESLDAMGYMANGAMPRQESFAEYHLYTMPRRATLKQNQTKQLALMAAAGVQFGKTYEFRGDLNFYSMPIPPFEKQHPDVFLHFKNEEANGLGIPLPAGIMRVYQEDRSGALQFAGEDRLEHTPKNEEVRLRLGSAFDVVCDRIQTDFNQVFPNINECAFEIVLRNHKEADIVVDVIEPMTADWQMLEKSMDFEKKDARTVIFHVPVPAHGEVKVTYRVRVKY